MMEESKLTNPIAHQMVKSVDVEETWYILVTQRKEERRRREHGALGSILISAQQVSLTRQLEFLGGCL